MCSLCTHPNSIIPTVEPGPVFHGIVTNQHKTTGMCIARPAAEAPAAAEAAALAGERMVETRATRLCRSCCAPTRFPSPSAAVERAMAAMAAAAGGSRWQRCVRGPPIRGDPKNLCHRPNDCVPTGGGFSTVTWWLMVACQFYESPHWWCMKPAPRAKHWCSGLYPPARRLTTAKGLCSVYVTARAAPRQPSPTRGAFIP